MYVQLIEPEPKRSETRPARPPSVRSPPIIAGKHTLQGLFNSKPNGAVGVSVCPLKNPVNLLSRSITILTLVGSSYCCLEGNYFAVEELAFVFHKWRSRRGTEENSLYPIDQPNVWLSFHRSACVWSLKAQHRKHRTSANVSDGLEVVRKFSRSMKSWRSWKSWYWLQWWFHKESRLRRGHPWWLS